MKLKIVTPFAFLLAVSPLGAHDLPHGPNGGRVVDMGGHHVELVVNGTGVTVFVTDSNSKPVAVGDFKGLAIVTVGGKTVRIILAPQKDTRLTGTAPTALPAGVRGVVQITLPDGKTAQGRFQ
jgi:hypothetical protein